MRATPLLDRVFLATSCYSTANIDDKALGVFSKPRVVGQFEKHIPQGLKPKHNFGPFTARLKSCPDTKQVFPAAIGTTPFQTDPLPSQGVFDYNQKESTLLLY
jgi:hypothetical protein